MSLELAKRLPEDFLWYQYFKGGNIPPWYMTDEISLRSCIESIKMQYPWHSDIYPFAYRDQDIALFAIRDGTIIVQVIHLGVRNYSEIDVEYQSFTEWFRAATAEAADDMSELLQR